uniref:Uncharacterized protein n=1 Tax=Cannabis sativa TaxID=3483 RepID=A0A803NIF7_CANSA
MGRSNKSVEGRSCSRRFTGLKCQTTRTPCPLPTVDVEALEKRLTFKVSLLAERAAKEVGMLVSKLEQVKVYNRDLHNTNKTLLAEITEVRLQVKVLQKENWLLEDENAHQALLI